MEHASRKSLHPLIAIAAIAVIVFSAAGIGAISGWIPTSRSTSDSPASLVEPTSDAQPGVREPARPKLVTPAPNAAPRSVQRAASASPAPAASSAPREPVRVAAAEPSAPPAPPVCFDCGVVESVREIKQAGDGSGIGAVAGGVAGAVLGHQVGGGRGRDLATVVGAVGGAVAGHQVEKHVKSNTAYQISVRMEDGSVRIFTESQSTWRTGDRVRVQGERLTQHG